LSWFVFDIRAYSIPQTTLSQRQHNQQRHKLQQLPINHTRSYRRRVQLTIDKSACHQQVQPAIDTYPNNYQVPPIEDTYRPTPPNACDDEGLVGLNDNDRRSQCHIDNNSSGSCEDNNEYNDGDGEDDDGYNNSGDDNEGNIWYNDSSSEDNDG
jgi:hypothetical protein